MTLIAAIVLPFALLQAAPDLAPLTGNGEARFTACVTLIDSAPDRAYEEGMAWAAESGELEAYRCAAMALSAQGRHEEAARRLEALVLSVDSTSAGARATLLSQAGNSWLLARDPAHARSALTRAIVLMQGDRAVMPDLLIDRARAYAMEADFRHAEEDLSGALDLRPQDALALRLRASARMHQNAFDLALTDAEAAVALEPENVDALLMRGHAIEAMRTGAPVTEQ